MHTNRNTPNPRNATQLAQRPTGPAAPAIEGSLTEWDRGADERLAVTIGEYEGKRFVQIRLYFKAKAGQWMPTKKGTSVRRHELRSVIEALEAAERELAPKERLDREERWAEREQGVRDPFDGMVTKQPTSGQGGRR